MRINFTDAPRKNFPQKTLLKVCIKMTCEIFKMKPIELSYIFVSDQWLLEMNKEYLNHDYFTDIITFDNSEEEGIVEGDIFVSLDRIRENANELNKPFEEELFRVLAHGVLHLVGYDDINDEQELEMREKEDLYLSQL
jgi:rRNA maturation RNase YbeY